MKKTILCITNEINKFGEQLIGELDISKQSEKNVELLQNELAEKTNELAAARNDVQRSKDKTKRILEAITNDE